MSSHRPALWTAAALAFCALLSLLLFPSPAQSAPSAPEAIIPVTTTADEAAPAAACSLRAAIQAANGDTAVGSCPAGAGADRIVLPAGVYQLQLAGAMEDANQTGDLDILSDLIISGTAGAVLDGAGLDRVLHMHAGTAVELLGLTIRNGAAPPGDGESNGGGILSLGALYIEGSTLEGNRAGSGTHFYDDSTTPFGYSYVGGSGGGVYADGPTTLVNSRVVSNAAGSGGDMTCWTACPADYLPYGGHGGGIYATGEITIAASRIADNSAGRGGVLEEPPGVYGAAGGHGGGIFAGGRLHLSQSTVEGNAAGDGGPRGGSHGAGGYGGAGGGIYAWRGGRLLSSTIHANRAGDATPFIFDWHFNQAGSGGGIAATQPLEIVNCTISGNRSGHQPSTVPGLSPDTMGLGGGIYSIANLTLTHSTVAGNVIEGPAPGRGAGLHTTGIAFLRSTILAGNVADAGALSACAGQVSSLNYNLLDITAGCAFAAQPGDRLDTDARLAPLADNGGPTWTHALGWGSPAHDAADGLDAHGAPVAADQRGVGRPQGMRADIGAYEEEARALRFLPRIAAP